MQDMVLLLLVWLLVASLLLSLGTAAAAVHWGCTQPCQGHCWWHQGRGVASAKGKSVVDVPVLGTTVGVPSDVAAVEVLVVVLC